MVDFSLWDIFRNLLLAARWTVLLSLIAFVGGGLVGMALLIARIAKLRGAEPLVGGYVQLFQGTPLLMQLFLAYFGLALLGINVSPWIAAKGTALASVIGFVELTQAGTMITNATFRPFTVYACLALMYFALCFPVSAWRKSLERKLHRGR